MDRGMVIFLGGWVLLGLMLMGPFLLLVTFALVAVALVIATAAILAPAYLLLLLVRDLRHRAHELLGLALRVRHERNGGGCDLRELARLAAMIHAELDNRHVRPRHQFE